MENVRVGVIGTGYMGKNHLRVYSEMEGVELIAFSDIDKKLVSDLNKQYKIKGYIHYTDLLEKEDIDAVSVAVPTPFHTKVIMDVFSLSEFYQQLCASGDQRITIPHPARNIQKSLRSLRLCVRSNYCLCASPVIGTNRTGSKFSRINSSSVLVIRINS